MSDESRVFAQDMGTLIYGSPSSFVVRGAAGFVGFSMLGCARAAPFQMFRLGHDLLTITKDVRRKLRKPVTMHSLGVPFTLKERKLNFV